MRYVAILLTEAEHNSLLNQLVQDRTKDEKLEPIIKKFSVPLETGSKTDENGTTRALFPLDLENIVDIAAVNDTCEEKLDKILSELSYFPVALEVDLESESRYSIAFGTLWLNVIGDGDEKEEEDREAESLS